ncbi:alkene reductase [Aquimarina sp. 2201CG5-10]|uniref:alkene reductase n=1 Tax=Aquimarina callyspongiae TaxID=3098150 RepID=UPI002AB3AA59|nr:alkene reductase [Aquimarina sp. 2201CG5-10]MDY8135977.1 alkene reductase [Aquimarina sp. 2201CG5-10]
MKAFESSFLGNIELNNKIVMAPLTRCRALNNIPNDLMKTYYGQRATAGLIISEGTSPSPDGLGYARMPGAYTDEQINGWRSIAEGIHEKGGKFYIQLMHAGRVASSLNLPEGARIISPSGVHLDSGQMYTDSKGFQPHDIPEVMTGDDIVRTKQEFVTSAKKLIEAGINGVELHAANGYLLEQFINPKTNQRTDEYGGDYKNRARFIIELAQELVNTIGGDKIGIRFSPYGVFNDMQGEYDDLVDIYTYLAQELGALGLAYIHIVDQTVAMNAPQFATDIKRTIKNTFKGNVIVGGNVHTLSQVENHLEEGYDLVYIGRPFISNPNLIEKLKNNETLLEPDYDTFYTADAVGYTDYA